MDETKKILIVEDNADLLTLLSGRLTEEGFAVVQAEDGSRGLTAAKEERPDLMILDLDIPGIEGLDMLKKLQEDGMATMPVIIFSNAADMDHLSQAMEQGVLFYLAKSDWTLDGVVEKIKTAFGTSQ